MAKVSVIVPVRAQDEEDVGWLETAIKSVLKQTEEDWELIVVNDDSIPLTRLRDYFKQDRVKGAKAKKTGVANARNQAAKIATSELLLPLDADDWLAPEALEELLKAWEHGGSDQGIVYSSTILHTKDTQRHYVSSEYNFDKLLRQLLMPIGSLHRKADWERVGGWKPEMEYGLEDWEYWITLGESGICGFHINLPLYHYRRHAKGRLAYLRGAEGAYEMAYQRMRKLHIETYSGRKPVGCCNPPTQRRNAPARRSLDDSQIRAVMAQTANDTLVPIGYTGPRAGGFYIKGISSGVRYHVPGPNMILTMPDGRRGVLPQDRQFILGQDRGRSFALQ